MGNPSAKKFSILALGNEKVTRRIGEALGHPEAIEFICESDLVEAIIRLKRQTFQLALVDGRMPDLVTTCFRIKSIYGTPLGLIVTGAKAKWDNMRFLDIDGYVPLGSDKNNLYYLFQEIILRGRKPLKEAKMSINVLIIEHELKAQESIRLAFRFYWPESRVYLPASGEDSLILARKKPVDIILLDTGLPDISSIEVLKQLRSFCQVPVIMLMANKNENIIVKSLKYGADDYLLKPIRQVELIARVRENIKRAKALS
jgi:DNA-binding response OmpR family regulator